jgi:hypothetical protein
MSLYGKILAIVNIFAVLGTLALLAMNYTKRQNWEYAVFRQDLMIDGLPLDDKETDPLQQTVVSKIGDQTSSDLFKGVSPSTAVKTQEAEVTRVQGELRKKFEGVGDKNKQIFELAEILKPMADTIEQRNRMISYRAYLQDDKTFGVLKARLLAAHKAATAPQEGQARPYEERFRESLNLTFSDPPGPIGEDFLAVMKADPKANFDKALEQLFDNQLTQLRGQFDQMFQNVSKTSEAAAQRRRGIARLLFNMVEVLAPDAKGDVAGNPAYKRFFVVVGVKAGVEAINDQGGFLQGLVFETNAERQRERNLFADEHRKVLDLALDKKTDVDNHKQLLAQKKKETDAHAETLDRRKGDIQLYERQLEAEREASARHLEQVRKVSDQLFAERIKLRENSEDNQKLEKQIRALEESR